MDLAIITAIHGRPEITSIFLQAMTRIYNRLGVPTYAVVTEGDESVDEVTNSPVVFFEHDNKPLGRKWNAVSRFVSGTSHTHFMILGSDDIPSDDFIKFAMRLDRDDVSGVRGMWFWSLNAKSRAFGMFGYWRSLVMLGAGKVVSRRVMEMVDWEPWPNESNYGLDAKMMERVKLKADEAKTTIRKHPYHLKDIGFLVDVKHTNNISSMAPIVKSKARFDRQDAVSVLPKHLPKDECDALFFLQDKMIKEWEQRR